LETAIHAWKKKIEQHDNGQSPARTSWSFKDPVSELDKLELLINRAEDLSREIKIRYPNLPQKFLDVMKIQYGKANIPGISGSNTKTKHTLIDKMDNIEGKSSLLKTEEASHTGLLSDEPSIRSATTTPSRSSGRCLGKEAYFSTPTDSP
nr:Rop guanine nucleotide exchange factor 14 [Tanacetum cinerariifolium]